ncbi:MAG: gamma-glutamylcyclotransferase family protein [Magnetospiraceae bacterium]
MPLRSSPDAAPVPGFFYGTLMDREILDLVVGRAVRDSDVEPAQIRGFRRVFVAGAVYPTLVRRHAARVEGLLVRGLTDMDYQRLAQYEGWEYRAENFQVRLVSGEVVGARCFITKPEVGSVPKDWSLADWRRRFKPRYLANLRRAHVPVSNRA